MKVNEELEVKIHELVGNYTYSESQVEHDEIHRTLVEDIICLIHELQTREDKVKEFHLAMNQVVNDKPTILDDKTIKLRLNLLQEELNELATAYGYYWVDGIGWHNPNFDTMVDQVEVFDTLLDLQYVLSGSIVSMGFSEIFDEGFDEVHRSNMSKTCDTKEQALKEQVDSMWETKIEENNGRFILQRQDDNKTIKPSTYSPANLASIISKENID